MAFITDGIKISALPKAQTGKLDDAYLLSYIEDDGNKNYQVPFINVKEKLAKDLIDEEFMPNSDNAQSGKAIHQMILDLDLDNRFDAKADVTWVEEVKEGLEDKIDSTKEELENQLKDAEERITSLENGDSLDDYVTADSPHGVKSSGIYEYIEKEVKTSTTNIRTKEGTNPVNFTLAVFDKKYNPARYGKITAITLPQPANVPNNSSVYLIVGKCEGTEIVEPYAVSKNQETQRANGKLVFEFEDGLEIDKEETIGICAYTIANPDVSNTVSRVVLGGLSSSRDEGDNVSACYNGNTKTSVVLDLEFKCELVLDLPNLVNELDERVDKLESGESLDDYVTQESSRGVKSSGIWQYIDDKTVSHYREYFEHTATSGSLANVKGSYFIVKGGIIPNNIILRSITLHPSTSANVSGWSGPVYLRINGTSLSEKTAQLQNATGPVTWTFDNILLNAENDVKFEWFQEDKQSAAWGAIRVDYTNDGTSKIVDNNYVNYCIPLMEITYANADDVDSDKFTTKQFVLEAINDRASQITGARFEEVETRLGDIITEVQNILKNFLTKEEANDLYLRGTVLYENELPPENERLDNYNYFLIEDERTKYSKLIRDLSDPSSFNYSVDCPDATEIDIELSCTTGKAYTTEKNVIITNVPENVVVRINGETMLRGNKNPYEASTLGISKAWFEKTGYELTTIGEDFVNGTLSLTPDYKATVDYDKEMILNITTPNGDFNLNLFDYVGGNSIDNAIVDWGDGSEPAIINSATSALSHLYKTAKDYQLKITGTIKWKGKEQYTPSSSLAKCVNSIELPSNNSPIVDIGAYGFSAFNDLTTIPAKLFANCTTVTSFANCFQYCPNLQSIPDGLFDNCTAATNFSFCFCVCNALQSIPAGLFNNCIKVTNFSYCFNGCASLQSIPEELFNNNALVDNFSSCFSDCDSLQTIPAKLFANNIAVTNFEQCFFNCDLLQAIPEHLFDNNTAVTSFDSCFNSCSSITNKLPELWVSHSTADGTRCFNNCDKAPNYEDAFNASWADWPVPEKFDGMILNLSISSDNYELDLFDYVGGSEVDNATINWGDGSSTVKINSSTSSLSHIYSTKGNYRLKINGTIKWKGKEQQRLTTSLSKCLISIELPTNNSPIVDIGPYGFDYFSYLTSIPEGLFDKCTEATSFKKCFWLCSKLEPVSEYLFDKCTKVTDFSWCFGYNDKLKSIPENLFANCKEVTDFSYCFDNCTALQSIPEGLFANNTKADNFTYCFAECRKLESIPAGLFSNCTKVTSFANCFRFCVKLQSIPTGLFDKCTEVTNFTYCFYSCYLLESIPTGLFSKSTKETDFTYCFYNCYNLQTLPENLFNSQATKFQECFRACSGLQSISAGLFNNCTKATDFTYCFTGCTSLQSLPEGLFNDCIEADDFSCCFWKCSALESIPAGLFSKCTKATDFGYCFHECTSLQSIPEGLFDKNTAVTSFRRCFQQCSALESIPAGLFDKNTAVTDFGYCFDNCVALQAIPERLFYNNKLVTNFEYCFHACIALQAIPEVLFNNNTLVTTFGYCFATCKKLESIPEGLFNNNTVVTDFNNCFYNCDSLQTIPAGLFANNTAVTSFEDCFNNCDSLQTIPENLFVNCTKVTNFDGCFADCTSVTSNLPTLWISHKTASHSYCFFRCTKALNYSAASKAGWTDR